MSDKDKKQRGTGLASTMAIMGDDVAREAGPALPFAAATMPSAAVSEGWPKEADTMRFNLSELKPVAAAPCLLLWCGAGAAVHARRHKPFRRVLDKLADAAADPELDDPALADDPQQAEQQREVFEVLANASPTLLDGLHLVLRKALRPDGKMVAPLALLAGTLVLEYDSKAALAACVSCTKPLAAQIKAVEEAIAHAELLLAGEGPGLSAGLYHSARTDIIRTIESSGHNQAASSVTRHVNDSLLEQRQYQRFEVLGAEHIRATLSQDKDRSVSVYLPAEVISLLPLKHQFRARVLGHLHIDIDTRGGLALAGCALARILDELTAPRTAAVT